MNLPPTFFRLSRAVALACALSSTFASAGCRKGNGAAVTAAEPTVVVKETGDDAQLLTWLDDKGDFHVEQKAASVPLAARDVVKVVDPTKDETTASDRIVVADLRTARPDGTYPVRFMARAEFDALALERRKTRLPTLASPLPSSALATGEGPAAAADAHDKPAIIVYGASWCGACHEAAKYFRTKGLRFVEKDIETDGAAAREMQAKLARAGLPAGSIPVIDVRGKVMVGFNPRAVEEALGKAI